jgi:anhydro-N-acetylmuramic acid kinase
MNKNLSRLFTIAEKPSRKIIGLMSGTSLDGLDIAFVQISGNGLQTKTVLLEFETVSYPPNIKNEIREIFAKENISFQHLCILNASLANLHAAYILSTLKKWNLTAESVDLIASHGQTVYHCPKIYHQLNDQPNATLQIADGDHIAVGTGIITISDFRQKHIAAGGEGAPLALYGDYFLFSKPGENRIMLNLGGISNFTFLPANGSAENIFVTDCGPGNTLIDAYTQKYFNADYDKDANFASQGKVNSDFLKALKSNEFFKKDLPKTTGPETFNLEFVLQAASLSSEHLNHFDSLATLTKLSADAISDCINKVIPVDEPCDIYLSGGGAHNPLLVKMIRENLPAIGVNNIDILGFSGDAKEAILFAVLANETIAGDKKDFHKTGMPAISMGKISFPE